MGGTAGSSWNSRSRICETCTSLQGKDPYMNMKRCIRAAACLALMLLAALPALPAQAATTNVKVALDCKLPPFQYQDSDGKLKGMHIELMNEIAERGNLNVEYVVFERTMDAVDALAAGEVDAVLGALPDDMGGHESALSITRELSSASTCMVVDNDKLGRVLNPDENPHRYIAAFELGTMKLYQLSQLNIMYTTIMGNQIQLYEALRNGEVDAIITVKDSVQHLMDQDDVNDRYTIALNYMTSVSYSILVRKNDRVLYRTLDETIGQLRASDRYEQILDKWIVNVELETAQARIHKLLIFIAIIAGVAAVIIGNTMYMNARLKGLVEKTREISRRMDQLEVAGELRNRLIEHSPGGSMLLHANGDVLLMNSVARSMVGISEESAPAENIQDMPVFGSIWEKAAPKGGVTMERPELIVLDAGESGKHTYRYQYHASSTPDEIVLLVEDVTREEREKQEVFEESKNQSLNRIIAGIAHEIKNPLMSIRAFASLIRRQGDDPEFQASFGEYVPKEVDRINRLIETLINYARPPRGQKERISIGDLIEDCVCLAHVSAKKEIALQCEVAVQAYVYGNKDQIRQALINLLINSIESVEAKLSTLGEEAVGRLCVRVSGFRRAGSIVIEVYDEGLGMSEDDVVKCTEPFFTTKKTGTGMGLALAKQFVQENAGQFEIESTPGAFTAIRMIFEEDIQE